MKNEELWTIYKDYTKTVTEVARKLGFAATAICWIFKTGNDTFPPLILKGLIFVVLYFLFDLSQFVTGAVIIRVWSRREEQKKWEEFRSIKSDYDKPAWIDTPSYLLWWAKIICLALSFVLIGLHLLQISS